jgi:hypothetical protein
MKSTTLRVLMLLLVLCATVTSSACRVRQTEEGELPKVDVDVSAEEGKLPEYDVDAADVDVGTKEVTVTVPDVDVDMPPEDTEPPSRP